MKLWKKALAQARHNDPREKETRARRKREAMEEMVSELRRSRGRYPLQAYRSTSKPCLRCVRVRGFSFSCQDTDDNVLPFLFAMITQANEDHCSACRSIGALVYCDGCPRAFHFRCLDPPMDASDIPGGDSRWFCPACDIRKVRCRPFLISLCIHWLVSALIVSDQSACFLFSSRTLRPSHRHHCLRRFST